MTAPTDLVPAADVDRRDGRWWARSTEPWLAAPGLARWAGRWVRLRYHAGLFDEHVRPLIRFTAAESSIVPMNGALTGVAEWTGRVPDGTREVAISPVRRPGPFSFALVGAAPVSRPALLARGLRAHPRLALTACGAWAIGAREEARHCLSFAALGTPMRDYASWRAARDRPIDLAGFDRPNAGWTDGPLVRVTVRPNGDPAAWDRTRAALDAQSYPRRCLHDADDGPDPGGPGELAVTLEAGDELLPHALALVVEHLAAHVDQEACYGDEEEAGPAAPRLKPDADPVFAASAGYRGDLIFRRRGTEPAPATIGHVRRLLVRRRFRPGPIMPFARPGPTDEVTAIIPTRDRPQLLAACLAGLFGREDRPRAIVLVDNGTVDPVALRLLDEAAARPCVEVLRVPGPFNYAALCNAGAARADTRFLLFLNNDVVPQGSGWLCALAGWAGRPRVGAVGARLFYPDGRLQHGGTVIGLGGTALHGHHRTRDAHGYLGGLDHARIVGAVTGAVMMVERAKFAAVDGFDAGSFPVLLNDIDLCLRLRARGWATVYEPAATLTHLESASRGRSARPFTLYGPERRRFAARWGDEIRDDPCFHPALSLTGLDPTLG